MGKMWLSIGGLNGYGMDILEHPYSQWSFLIITFFIWPYIAENGDKEESTSSRITGLNLFRKKWFSTRKEKTRESAIDLNN